MIKITKGQNVVVMDAFGRVMLSKAVRKQFPARKFEVLVKKEEIRLKPIKTLDELFGTLPKISMVEFRKKHDEEAKHEHTS